MPFPTVAVATVPHLDREAMGRVDRAMAVDYGIDLVRMMEHAGRQLARLARVRFWGGDAEGRRVVVLAGSGGNGGGALGAARWLAARGAEVSVVLARPVDAMIPATRAQVAILARMGVPVSAAPEGRPDLILDGLIGYSLRGAPRGTAAVLIDWTHSVDAPVLALDLPSGVDADDGTVYTPAVRAAATLTLALPKTGLLAPEAQPQVGEIYLADIGVPPALYAADPLRLTVGPLFARGGMVRLV